MNAINRILFIASSVCVLLACQKEAAKQVNDDKTVLLTINAGTPETKTEISGTTPSWSNGDKLTVVYKNTSAEVEVVNTAALNEDGAQASFTAALVSPDDSKIAYAYYPSNSKSATETTATLVIGTEQYPSATSFDGDADILISEGFVPASSVNARFKRLGAILKIKVTNSDLEGERLLSLSVTGTNPLAGDVAVDMAEGTISGISNGSNTVTAKYYSENQFEIGEAGKYVYLVVAPQVLENTSHLVVEGVTSGHTFSKNITLTQDIVLKSGHIQPLTISVIDIDETDYVSLDWEWNGGTRAQLTAITGVSGNGLGSDYAESNAPYRVKFDTNGDYVQVKVGSSISSVTIGGKIFQTNNTLTVNIKASSDGTSWTTVQTLSKKASTANEIVNLSTSSAFSSADRFVRIERSSGDNFGLGYIYIAGSDSRAEAGIDWKKSSVSADEDDASITSIATTLPAITLDNPNELPIFFTSSDPEVATVEASTSEITMSNGAVLELVGAGTTTITAIFKGNKLYAPASVEYTLNVTDSREVVTKPVISITSNTATITCATEGASIYYTVDGSTPTSESNLYTVGFAVEEGATVKAIATKAGYKPSGIATKKNVTETVESITTGTFTLSNSTLIHTTSSGVVITQAANGGTAVNSSYNGVSSLRVYRQNTLTFAGKTFTKIVITYKESYNGSDGLKIAVGGGDLEIDTNSKTITWSNGEGASAVTIQNGESTDSNTQIRTNSFTVTYQ